MGALDLPGNFVRWEDPNDLGRSCPALAGGTASGSRCTDFRIDGCYKATDTSSRGVEIPILSTAKGLVSWAVPAHKACGTSPGVPPWH